MEQINVGDAGVDIVLEQKMGRSMHNKIVIQINYPATRPAANNIQNGDEYKAIKEQYFGIGGLGYVELQFQRRRVTARTSYSVYLA